jgi:hypothetical protein
MATVIAVLLVLVVWSLMFYVTRSSRRKESNAPPGWRFPTRRVLVAAPLTLLAIVLILAIKRWPYDSGTSLVLFVACVFIMSGIIALTQRRIANGTTLIVIGWLLNPVWPVFPSLWQAKDNARTSIPWATPCAIPSGSPDTTVTVVVYGNHYFETDTGLTLRDGDRVVLIHAGKDKIHRGFANVESKYAQAVLVSPTGIGAKVSTAKQGTLKMFSPYVHQCNAYSCTMLIGDGYRPDPATETMSFPNGWDGTSLRSAFTVQTVAPHRFFLSRAESWYDLVTKERDHSKIDDDSGSWTFTIQLFHKRS